MNRNQRKHLIDRVHNANLYKYKGLSMSPGELKAKRIVDSFNRRNEKHIDNFRKTFRNNVRKIFEDIEFLSAGDALASVRKFEKKYKELLRC